MSGKTVALPTEFKGAETVRRALAIAAIGGHSLAFFGPAGCGKSCFRALVPELTTFEERLCPCGCRGDRHRLCECTVAQVMRHQRRKRFRQALETDMLVECSTPPAHLLRGRGWTPEAFAAEVAENRARRGELSGAAQTHGGALPVDAAAEELLVYAVRNLAFTMRDRDSAIRVAATIASMDGKATIEASHMAEAIQYRRVEL